MGWLQTPVLPILCTGDPKRPVVILTTGCSPGATDPQLGGDLLFYQAADGQWVFLHPVNMRMLTHAHSGSLPPTITARVVEREVWEQSEQTRRKLRVLSHIPLTGAFDLCEVELAPLVPKGTMEAFAEELGARRDKRNARAAAEARREEEERAREAREAAARQV